MLCKRCDEFGQQFHREHVSVWLFGGRLGTLLLGERNRERCCVICVPLSALEMCVSTRAGTSGRPACIARCIWCSEPFARARGGFASVRACKWATLARMRTRVFVAFTSNGWNGCTATWRANTGLVCRFDTRTNMSSVRKCGNNFDPSYR